MIARRRHTQSVYSTHQNHQSYTSETQTQTFVTDNSNTFANTETALIEDSSMTCRDRTNEFMSAVKSMQSRQVCKKENLYFLVHNFINLFFVWLSFTRTFNNNLSFNDFILHVIAFVS